MASGPNIYARADWVLPPQAPGVRVRAEPDGLEVSLAQREPAREPATRLGKLLPTLLPQLEEMALAERVGGGYRIPYPNLVGLGRDRDIDAFDDLAPWVPWPLEIESSGSPGTAGFWCRYRFYSTTGPVYPDRRGCFVRDASGILRLDADSYALIEAIDAFSSLPEERRTGSAALIELTTIKGLAEDVGAELDRFWRKEHVVVPTEIGVQILREEGGRVSLAPSVAGVSDERLAKEFMAGGSVPEVYSLRDGDKRVRLVLNEAQREALRRMQEVRHLSGPEKALVMRDLGAAFDGVGDVVQYGPRVTGIGDFPFKTEIFRRTPTGILGQGASAPARYQPGGIRCTYSDGSVEESHFQTPEEAKEFCAQVHCAWRSGQGIVEHDGRCIVVDAQLDRAARDLEKALSEPDRSTTGKFLLVYRNDGSVEYQEDFGAQFGDSAPELPVSLRHDAALRPHQLQGLAWLQRCFKAGRHGCLLADDMGLGKTVQVLAFIAWLIEAGLTADGSDRDLPPWRPVLVAAPLPLVEMEVWRRDARKFFSGDGSVFEPWCQLRGSELERLRAGSGAETRIGGPRLDWKRLKQSRVVVTNYETVVQFQHSFAMRDLWSVAVTDEAQRGKTPDTKISHALKSLSPQFRVACTGTPVETRLADLWNIMDYLQPGRLLNSAREFEKKYVAPPEEGAAADRERTANLRAQLKLGRPDAFLLRREKSLLAGLPAKHVQVLHCKLSTEQRAECLSVMALARSGAAEPFQSLLALMRISEHPFLYPRYEPRPAEDLIAACPKLTAVLETLAHVRRKGERALVFARFLDTQEILRSALVQRFCIHVGIVNGASPRTGDSVNAKKTRSAIIDEFQRESGFGVLILSPEVAGFGLNLVEANHVFHYGRWWNPAKEDQATDRVYRLGQTRDVHVYLPVAADPLGEFRSFDEGLDDLLKRRRRMAADFLTPQEDDKLLQKELFESVTRGPASEPGDTRPLTMEDVAHLGWRLFEALVATIERKQGDKVFLTPGTGDDRADVVAMAGTTLRLIQCKHIARGAAIDDDALSQILSAVEIYRHRHLRSVEGRFTVRPVVATNGMFSARAAKRAQELGIELISGREISEELSRRPCSSAEVATEESRRLPTMAALQQAVARA